MKRYLVSAMVPITYEVEADSFEDAVDKYMDEFSFEYLSIGNPDPTCGFAVTDLETDEQQII